MANRKERIRPGLEIDIDLLDSDMCRCVIPLPLHWSDGKVPFLLWSDFVDRGEGPFDDEHPTESRTMTRTLDNDREVAEARRMVRLQQWKSYGSLDELRDRTPEPGVFVIRQPPQFGWPKYVCDLDESRIPSDPPDPDAEGEEDRDLGCCVTTQIENATHFTHEDALRLTVKIMVANGIEIPEPGHYYEPIRLDIAEELHRRALVRPRRPDAFYAMLHDLSREP